MIKRFKVPIKTNVPIVDNEISNDISFNWDYLKGIPHCIGIFYKDEIIQLIFTKDESEEDFKRQALKILETLPQPLLAFNLNMEVGNFLGYFGKRFNIEEIKPFNGRGSSKDACFEHLSKNDMIPKEVSDILHSNVIDGREMEKAFQDNEYDKISEHNHNCLIKEFCIMQNKDWFLKNFKISSSGWLIG